MVSTPWANSPSARIHKKIGILWVFMPERPRGAKSIRLAITSLNQLIVSLQGPKPIMFMRVPQGFTMSRRDMSRMGPSTGITTRGHHSITIRMLMHTRGTGSSTKNITRGHTRRTVTKNTLRNIISRRRSPKRWLKRSISISSSGRCLQHRGNLGNRSKWRSSISLNYSVTR